MGKGRKTLKLLQDISKRKKISVVVFVLLAIWIFIIIYFSLQPPNVSHNQSLAVVKMLKKIDSFFDISHTSMYMKITDFLKDKWFFGLYKSTNMVVRKSAHFGIYFLLGIFATIFGYMYSRKKLIGLFLGIGLSMTVAVLDEYNQGFVERTSSLDDVIIDGVGATIGTLLVIFLLLLFKFFKWLKETFFPVP